jgi:DNA-binding response OmpR family regulator
MAARLATAFCPRDDGALLRRNSTMADPFSPAELDARIAAIRENIRQLVEQAAASSGASDESLTADRIADYEAQLAAAIKQRESMR